MSLQFANQKALTLEIARRMSAAAEAEAAKNDWTVVIAIVDAGGHLLHLVRMDGTQYASVEIAALKAKTAVAFKRPSKAFEDVIAGGRTAVLGMPGIVPLAGGLPIIYEGQTLGAIGVSGVQSHQDAQVAQAGLDALAATLG
jgi:uncharacterized protein GlcG (DUF336 family)